MQRARRSLAWQQPNNMIFHRRDGQGVGETPTWRNTFRLSVLEQFVRRLI